MPEEFSMDVDDLVVIPAGEGIDFTEYEGIKVKINEIQIKKMLSDFDPKDGKMKPGLQREVIKARIMTEPVLVLKNREGKEIPVRASEFVNLKMKDGVIGYSDSPKSKVQQVLVKYKIKHLKELKGKTAVVTVRERNGKQFFGLVI